MPTIVVDAGHGGYDNGAVHMGRLEKNDNLRMALAVGKRLKDCGFRVVYTRNTDVFVPLLERSYLANRAAADLFVSIHRNASVLHSLGGVENFVYTVPSATAVAAANYVLDRVVAAGVQANRGLKYANFSVLRETAAPAMLIELGFITNDEDNRLFDDHFNAYADAITAGSARIFGVTCPPATPSPEFTATVRKIQQLLNERYGAGLSVDGVWGPLSTRALIRGFQIELNQQFDAGLVTDGVWGPLSARAARPLRIGDRGNRVYLLQAALYLNGFTVIPDGIFGPNTELTVRNFQRANDLSVDGIAGPATFERLFLSLPH